MVSRAHFCADFIDVLPTLKDQSVDFLCTDLPYGGVTACKWDTPVNLDLMWRELLRVMKPKATMVFTANQPFASSLIMSNRPQFKYEFIWSKNRGTGFQIVKYRPLMSHENILVFCKTTPNYYPQMRDRDKPRVSKNKGTTRQMVVSNGNSYEASEPLDKRYPISVLDFPNNNQKAKIHPTQKPVELIEYLIKTFSLENDTVLDICAGSFTAAVARDNLNRSWICVEKDPDMYNLAMTRVNENWNKKCENV